MAKMNKWMAFEGSKALFHVEAPSFSTANRKVNKELEKKFNEPSRDIRRKNNISIRKIAE